MADQQDKRLALLDDPARVSQGTDDIIEAAAWAVAEIDRLQARITELESAIDAAQASILAADKVLARMQAEERRRRGKNPEATDQPSSAQPPALDAVLLMLDAHLKRRQVDVLMAQDARQAHDRRIRAFEAELIRDEIRALVRRQAP